ncbi:sugar transporter-like protein 21 [Elsinoe australis]|uniref:Sugar transporter-like protein 21 n=1 Tax=Elsinoe australis TaxID=40998 RepID=A0A4V6DTY6_9PEZI|nr:sugar transporter-like protein 21 [Elsinoe australis]
MANTQPTAVRRPSVADQHIEPVAVQTGDEDSPRTSYQNGLKSSFQVGQPEKPTSKHIYLDNPLTHFSPPELEAAVRAFAEATKLEGITDLLIKGAKYARNPATWLSIPGLTAEEKEVLGNESQASFLEQTKELQVTLLACACGAVAQGWDQASLNGANLRWPEDLNLASGLDSGLPHDVWMFAFVNAAPYIFASIFCYLSDPLNEYLFGRRGAIFVAAIFSLITVVGSACVKTLGQLLVCRILLGVGIGNKAGSLVMNWQVFVAFGLFLGHSANLAVFGIHSINWRLQLAAAALPAIPLIVLIFVCPESPRFLIKKQRWKEAYRSLCYLNKLPLIAAKELFLIHTQIQAESRMYSGKGSDVPFTEDMEAPDTASLADNKDVYVIQRATSYIRRFRQLFTVPRIRRASMAAFVIMITQQLCGVNVMTFYSGTIVSGDVKYSYPEDVKYASWRKALWISWGTGLTNFLFAYPAYGTIDRWGRRALVLTTLPFLALTLVAAALCFQISNADARLPAVATFLILYMIFYSVGAGPVPFTYSAEVFPLVNREVGMSFAVFTNLFGAGLLSLFVPFLNTSLTATGLLFLFAGLNVIAFVLVYLFLYETKQAMLEEMNSMFSVPTGWHIRYQFQEMAPWIWNRWIRRRDLALHEWNLLVANDTRNTINLTIAELRYFHIALGLARDIVEYHLLRIAMVLFVTNLRRMQHIIPGFSEAHITPELLNSLAQAAALGARQAGGFTAQVRPHPFVFPGMTRDALLSSLGAIGNMLNDIIEFSKEARQGVAEGQGQFSDYHGLQDIIRRHGVVLEAEHAAVIFSAVGDRITGRVGQVMAEVERKLQTLSGIIAQAA